MKVKFRYARLRKNDYWSPLIEEFEGTEKELDYLEKKIIFIESKGGKS